MNLLMVGLGSGSWQVRGVQMGRALGARVTSRPSADDWAWAEVVVLIKRAIDAFGERARASGARVVWDAVDFWQQPEQNQTPIAELIAEVHERRDRYGIHTIIAATQRMAEDVGGVYLPHHSRPGLTPQAPREDFRVVAYEGTPKYLGSWHRVLERICADVGADFVVNPADLRVADLVVALRGEKWDGEVCRRWKSGVKYVNAIAAGRPVVTQFSDASSEISLHGGSIGSEHGLRGVVTFYARPEHRLEAYKHCRGVAPDYSLERIAARYRSILSEVARKAA